MKKILAAAVIAILTVALCVSASATSLVANSFDRIYANDLENWLVDGGADGWAAQNPIDGEITALRLRGWARISGASIEAFGYKIDENEPVLSADFICDRPDVQAAFGITAEEGNGYDMSFDVSGIGKGEHTVRIVVKGSDGEVVDVNGFTFTQELEAAAQPTNPPAGDAAVVAIAAVGCIALAGAVVSKKVK